MKKLFLMSLLCVGVTFPVASDTVELYTGTILEGEFTGISNGIMMFKTGGGVEAFPLDHVVAIYFGAGVERARAFDKDSAAATNAVQTPAPAPAPATITVPAGTRLVLRMSDTVDSSRHRDGHRFRAQLESALVVDGVTVVPRDTILQGRVVSAQQAGRARGSSELSIQISDVMLNDQLHPIVTGELSARTQNEAGNTLRRTARGAAIGAMFDGGSGARTGAAIGASVSLVTRGQQINIPSGTILETSLTVPLTVPR